MLHQVETTAQIETIADFMVSAEGIPAAELFDAYVIKVAVKLRAKAQAKKVH